MFLGWVYQSLSWGETWNHRNDLPAEKKVPKSCDLPEVAPIHGFRSEATWGKWRVSMWSLLICKGCGGFRPWHRTRELAGWILVSFFTQNLLKVRILSSSNEASGCNRVQASINPSIHQSINLYHKSYIRLRWFLWVFVAKNVTWISEAEAPKPVFASVAEKGWSFYMMIWNTEVQRWHSRIVG